MKEIRMLLGYAISAHFWQQIRILGQKITEREKNPDWMAEESEFELASPLLVRYVEQNYSAPHLKRLLSKYVHYYHEDRTHLGLGKQTPGNRRCSLGRGRVIAFP